MQTVANKTVEILREKNLTVAAAESCTGGLVAAKITSVSGSSAVISFSMTTYSNEVKIEKLGVSRKTIEEFGAVSKQTAREMAENIRKMAKADIGVSVTGVAGPSMSEGKAVGTVFIGICTEQKTMVEQLEEAPLTRDEIREKAAERALELVLETAKAY